MPRFHLRWSRTHSEGENGRHLGPLVPSYRDCFITYGCENTKQAQFVQTQDLIPMIPNLGRERGVWTTTNPGSPGDAGGGTCMRGVGGGWRPGLLVVRSFLSERSSVSLRGCNDFLFRNKQRNRYSCYLLSEGLFSWTTGRIKMKESDCSTKHLLSWSDVLLWPSR